MTRNKLSTTESILFLRIDYPLNVNVENDMDENAKRYIDMLNLIIVCLHLP